MSICTHWPASPVHVSTNLYVAGEDYESVDSIIMLAPMEQVLKYDVVILDDQRVERQEEFSVQLEIAPGQDEVSGLTLGQSRTEVFIKDNHCEPEIMYHWHC